ncbi:MAG: SulP family inorganic anion transporter [Alphaproteobacteria bacterium]
MFAALQSIAQTNYSNIKQGWFSNTPRDLVAGLVVALALIPEAIAFSIIAGVAPQVGLYASFSIAVITSIFGGRPAMISAATAAIAVLFKQITGIEGISQEEALNLIFAATILGGIFQVIAGWLRLGSLMRFVSRSVITGFVNALAILIFLAQLHAVTGALEHGYGVTWITFALILSGLVIIYGWPLISKSIPSPLVTILVLTMITLIIPGSRDFWTVGDEGQLPNGLPFFLLPDIPWTFDTLLIVLPVSVAIAVVGLLESLMTATIVEDATETLTERNRECMGQGAANLVTGFFGGMAGCAMIGQSIINVKSGGRGRLSCFSAGIFLLILVVFLGEWVSMIPMAALVAVMIMVSISTFSWDSINNLKTHPRTTSFVMISTVIATVGTENLAIGVFTGVLFSGIFFAWKIASTFDTVREDEGDHRTYRVTGQLFFATVERFNAAFAFNNAPSKVTIDVREAHIWDVTAVNALDKAILKYRRAGATVAVLGMNRASETLVAELSEADKPGAMERLLAH